MVSITRNENGKKLRNFFIQEILNERVMVNAVGWEFAIIIFVGTV